MTKNRIKNLGRRGLALFLSLVMVTSLMQITVFAAEPSSGKVMDGSFVLNEDGSVNTDAAGTTEGVVSGADHDTITYEEDGFTLTKTAVKTGENQFDVTLQVVTSQTKTTTAPVAAVQLVIDISTSMNDCGTCTQSHCNHPSRMTELKNVLTGTDGFLDKLFDAKASKLYVSVVTYGQGANTVCGWTDIKAGNGLATVEKAINNLSANAYATNIEAGLMLARNRLGMSEPASADVKYTVLLTDGQANCYVRNDSTSTESISSRDCTSASSSAGTPEGKAAAKEMAAEVTPKSTLYGVGYGTDKTYLADIIGNENNTFAGGDSEAIANAFNFIAEEAVSGITGAGTSVTDPMGKLIVLGDVSGLSGKGVTSSGGTLTWKLNPKQAEKKTVGDTTTYTYSITYPITLNTAAEGFVEDQNYPTNGYTYLSIPQEGGDPRKLAFRVPGVSGKVPEVDWTVEYYLQNADSIGKTPTYPTEPADTKTFKNVDVWTPVNAPDGYKTKYASTTGDDYVFASGEVTMQVKPTGENVMRLYYDLVTANVIVNHYYKTDTINVDGTVTPGSYSATPDATDDPVTWKVNNEFPATPKPVVGSAQYTLDEQASDDLTIKVAKVAEDEENPNIINLYYTRVDDKSVKTTALVNHVYRTYAYELGADGKYGEEPVLQSTKTEEAQKAALVYATTRFDVSDQPIDGYKDQGYVLNTEEGNYSTLLQADGTLSFIVDKEANNNIRTLYFDKVIDRRVPVTVTVNHYYTKSVTSIEDGEVVTTVNPDGVKGNTSTVNAYEGEKFATSEINDYNGDKYVSDSGNEAKLVIPALPNADSVIDLYYTLDVVPETSLVVNHYWVTRTEVTVEETKEVEETVVDADGNATTVKKTVVVGTKTEVRWDIDDDYISKEVTLNVGEEYTAPKEAKTGYTYNKYSEYESKDTGIGGIDSELNLYYYKDANADERDDAEIDVQHNYVTNLTTIVNGESKTIPVKDGTVTEDFSDKLAGDEFTATAKPVYNKNEYTQITKDSELGPVILQPDTNATIVINYERAADDRVATNYSVDHVYKTYTMAVKDGVAGYYEDPAVETVHALVDVPGYVEQKVTLDVGAKEGFSPLTTNPGTIQTLAASGNKWTFVHEKYVPLNEGSVTVNHYYSCQTIALDGTITWTSSSVLGDPEKMYLGESYTTEPVTNGYQQMDSILDGAAFAAPYELTVSGNHVVDFHYKKVVDERKTADYTVTHDYYLYDYNGTLLSHPDPKTVEFTGYVAHPVTAHPDDTDYTLTKVTFNGVELTAAPYTQTLVQGENAFVFTYVKTLPQDKVDVKVIHNYYKDVASMTGETAEVESQYVETVTQINEDEKYTAVEHVLENAAYTYTWHSADPADKTITAVDDVHPETGETVNVIIMNYIRATAEYQVIHIYNRNGVEEGRTSETLGGLDGDVVLADSIERVPVFEGRTYTFQSITGDITLDADEMQTITLVYNRKTSGGGGGGGGTIIIPETPVPQDPAPQPEPMPEPEVPLAPAPEEEELFDEEIPLAEAPKTGDATALWMILSALSGTGLAGMSLVGRKKRED